MLSPKKSLEHRLGAYRQPFDAQKRRSSGRAFGQRCRFDASRNSGFDRFGKILHGGRFVEELMNPHNRAAVLIVDPHGEYHTMSRFMGDAQFFGADGYKPEVKIFTPDKIKVRFSTLTEADVKYLLPEGTSDKMLHFLSQAFRSLNES
jgi:hypothetical protein